ncbi:unnamed protein product [Cuscuta campestris]|uniref:Uncharacterized protein n=1 Tax=Cuscuta campestris TaxID=132261 RepID=A0A484L0N7_9ASTE|nr:unnamed protein product [Cuscuta campestris]
MGDGKEFENRKEKKSKLKLPKKDAIGGCNEHQRKEEVVRKTKQKTIDDYGKHERIDRLDEMLREVLKGISSTEKSNKILSKKVDAVSNDFKEHRRTVEACLEKAGLLSEERGRKEQRARDRSIPSFDLGLDSDNKNEDGECSGDLEVKEGMGTEYGVVAKSDGDKALVKACDESERAGDQSELHMDVEKENATVNVSAIRTPETVNVAGFKDTFETPTQICEALKNEPLENLFYPLDFNVFSVEHPRPSMVVPLKELHDLIKAVEEEVKSSYDDEDVNRVGNEEEKCTQMVVYNPMNNEATFMDEGEAKNRPKREMKATRRFTPGEDALGRTYKRLKTNTCRMEEEMFRMEEEMFRGPFSKDPDAMPPNEALKTVEKVLFDGLLKNHLRVSGRKYFAERDQMDPREFKPLYGLEATLSKSWYYKLFFHGHG